MQALGPWPNAKNAYLHKISSHTHNLHIWKYVCMHHRRRINIQYIEKAKFGVAVWGTEFNQFLAIIAILHWRIEWIHPFLQIIAGAIRPFLQIVLVQTRYSRMARNWINSFSQTAATNLCLFFCIYPSSMAYTHRMLHSLPNLRAWYPIPCLRLFVTTNFVNWTVFKVGIHNILWTFWKKWSW